MGTGSKIDVHTVLKLIDDAITATTRLVGRQLRQRHLVEVQRLPRILLLRRHPGEHLLLVGAHDRTPVGTGQRERGEVVGGRSARGSRRGSR